MSEYLEEVRKMEKFFNDFEVHFVPQMDNKDQDHLTSVASSRAPMPLDVIIERLAKPSVNYKDQDIELAAQDLMVIDDKEPKTSYD
jgi:hypothetical protein